MEMIQLHRNTYPRSFEEATDKYAYNLYYLSTVV